MVWGAKMPLKINQKISEILDQFLRPFLEWKRLATAETRQAVCRRWVPGILNLPRISLNTLSHALLPQRGAADLF